MYRAAEKPKGIVACILIPCHNYCYYKCPFLLSPLPKLKKYSKKINSVLLTEKSKVSESLHYFNLPKSQPIFSRLKFKLYSYNHVTTGHSNTANPQQSTSIAFFFKSNKKKEVTFNLTFSWCLYTQTHMLA